MSNFRFKDIEEECMSNNVEPIIPKMVVEIILLSDGNIKITGPIDDPILCYGMMERARDAIKDHNDRKVKMRPIKE